MMFRIIYSSCYITQICFTLSCVLYHSINFIHLEKEVNIVLEEIFLGQITTSHYNVSITQHVVLKSVLVCVYCRLCDV